MLDGTNQKNHPLLFTMFEFIMTLLCLFLYLTFRPRRNRVMVMNGMWFEYPTYADVHLIRNFRPLLEWQNNMRNGLLQQGAIVEKVSVRDTYMFGPHIGFMLIDVLIYMDGVKLPGAVLLRGKSVAVLLWYRDCLTNMIKVVLVRQPRVATGRMTWEVPAGMADGNGDLKGQMFTEIKEETGLTLNMANLKHHTFRAPYTSSGLLDEALELYSMEISPEVMTGIVDKPRGCHEDGEVITNVDAVSLTDARALEDGKLRILLSSIKM